MTIKNKSKSIGNSGERKIAKDLSLWIWNDPDILKREPTSGATKSIYTGDIFPMAQIDWPYFPFHIEVKWGYSDHVPTLLNFKIISKWYLKCIEESTLPGSKQEIILLIMNFKNRQGILVATNRELNIPYKCILNINQHIVFCYDFKEMLNNNFEEVYK